MNTTTNDLSVAARSRSKAVAAWLACLLGWLGVHDLYLGRRIGWLYGGFSILMIVFAQLYPVWWDNPPFLLLGIPITAGFIEALIYALMSDDKFDARFNPGLGVVNRSGWPAVLAAIYATLFGAIASMAWLAMSVMYVYIQMGWLDGYVF
jgi:TM2 domain-containing membrane protein YozV